MEQRTSRASPGGVLGIVGGLLAIVGSALVWFKARADTSRFPGGGVLTKSVKGTDASDGKITLVLGIVLVLAAAGIWALRAGGGRKGLSVLALLCGLSAGAIAVYDVSTAQSQVIDAAVKQVGTGGGLTSSQVRAFLERAFAAGILKITPGIGLFLVIAGGALGLLAGIVGIAGGRQVRVAVAGGGDMPPIGAGMSPPPPVAPMPWAAPQEPPAVTSRPPAVTPEPPADTGSADGGPPS